MLPRTFLHQEKTCNATPNFPTAASRFHQPTVEPALHIPKFHHERIQVIFRFYDFNPPLQWNKKSAKNEQICLIRESLLPQIQAPIPPSRVPYISCMFIYNIPLFSFILPLSWRPISSKGHWITRNEKDSRSNSFLPINLQNERSKIKSKR